MEAPTDSFFPFVFHFSLFTLSYFSAHDISFLFRPPYLVSTCHQEANDFQLFFLLFLFLFLIIIFIFFLLDIQ